MRYTLVAFLVIAAVLFAAEYLPKPTANSPAPTSTAAPQAVSIETAFSPDQGATSLVVKAILSARHKVHLAGYSFTSEPVAQALIEAHDKGVDVEVVVDDKDNRNARGSKVDELDENHVPIRLNDHYAIMHDKFIIIDDRTVETGSFNYTASAEHRNAENVLVMHDVPAIAAKYEAQWQTIWSGGVGRN